VEKGGYPRSLGTSGRVIGRTRDCFLGPGHAFLPPPGSRLRRHQKHLLTITFGEVRRHAGIVVSSPDRTPFVKQLPRKALISPTIAFPLPPVRGGRMRPRRGRRPTGLGRTTAIEGEGIARPLQDRPSPTSQRESQNIGSPATSRSRSRLTDRRARRRSGDGASARDARHFGLWPSSPRFAVVVAAVLLGLVVARWR
jgi:hypothetical protein